MMCVNREAKRLLVVGTGYVGLVIGACFANKGHRVVCLDIDQKKIDQLNRGIIPIYEPGLEALVVQGRRSGCLSFETDYASTVEAADICFLAVDTPFRSEGFLDKTALHSAVRSIGKYMNGPKIIVNKSTAPVGTIQEIDQIIKTQLKKRQVAFTFQVVSNPEFLREGQAVEGFSHPDRVIIG